jgi:hypothetical protein
VSALLPQSDGFEGRGTVPVAVVAREVASGPLLVEPAKYFDVLPRHRPHSIAGRLTANHVREPLGKCSRPDSAARRIQMAMVEVLSR